MAFSKTVERPTPAVNETGYAHLALEVDDLHDTVSTVVRSGGSLQGEITNFGTQDQPHLIVYVRDPEGNILELEQSPG
jgi:predicted enzyme related to lactoylglutathione lyase